MSEQDIQFHPAEPWDPNDPQRVPAHMEFTPLLLEGQAYLEWKLSEAVRLRELRSPENHPEVLDLLLSAHTARCFARALLEAVQLAEEMAEDKQAGGPGRPKRRPKRMPPPPPPAPRA